MYESDFISPSTMEALFKLTRKTNLDLAIREFFRDAVEHRLEKIEKQLISFQKKYHKDFEEFKKAWEADKIPNKYSYEVEKDYWEWEGLISRKNKLKEVYKWFH